VNAARSRRRHSTRARQNRRAITLPVVAIAAVAMAAVVALTASLVNGDEETVNAFDSAGATVDGTDLARFATTEDDPDVGRAAPVIEGRDRDGDEITTPEAGRPTILLFVAHWCPHCQAEVPVVQDWVDDGGLPDDVDLVTVATSIDDSRPNYPPSDWLSDEGWTSPTVADADGSAAEAYGLSAFPYWVVVDSSGRVVLRTTGELTHDQLDQLVETALAD
jgi:cytochrome c biogenesis protein CcmG, thiol:disulfide interchange protein DsbE